MTGLTIRKGALLNSGTPSPNPWDLAHSRQNGCSTLKALERRIGLRRDATRAPIQAPEWHGAGSQSRPKKLKPKTPPDISLLRAKNGLDNGVHFIGTPESPTAAGQPIESGSWRATIRSISKRVQKT